MQTRGLRLLLTVFQLTLMACSSPPATRVGEGELGGDGDSGDGDSGDGDGDGDSWGGDGDSTDNPDINTECGEIEKTAEVERGPVDIILGMDTSLSMAASICNVSTNLTAFAMGIGEGTHVAAVYDMGILGAAAAAACGQADPLGATPLAKDAKRYLHVATALDSNNGLSVMVDSFDKYKSFLRDGAPTHIIMLTDDNAELPYLMADTFQSAMEAKLGHKFYYHAIVAPDASCPTIGGIGTEHVKLAQATGGKVLSICGNFAELFKDLQSAVVASAPLPCDFEIPPAPEGEAVDIEYGVRVMFGSSGKSKKEFPRATQKADCGDKVGWYANDAKSRIEFCPAACDLVKKGGALSIGFGCAATIL
ncbi:MAG: hypothetical protein QM778_21175 [Myxococcales bacterium]